MPRDVRDTLGAVLIGSAFAAVFVIFFFSFRDCEWADGTQLDRGRCHASCVLL